MGVEGDCIEGDGCYGGDGGAMNVLDDALIQDIMERYEYYLKTCPCCDELYSDRDESYEDGTCTCPAREDIGRDESMRLVLELTKELRRLRDELFPKQKQLKQSTEETHV